MLRSCYGVWIVASGDSAACATGDYGRRAAARRARA